MLGKKFALIGNGYIGQRHIDAIRSLGGELLMIADINPEREVKGIPFYRDHLFFVADPHWSSVDTVVICTPNILHIPMAIWARRYGKQVLCEKPIGTNAKDVEQMFGLNDVHVVMQLRHHPEYKRMKVENPRPKDISLFVKVKRDESYWKGWKGSDLLSGGILFNIGIHYFDALFNLVGTNCVLVTREINTEKLVKGSLRMVGCPKDIKFHIEISDTSEGQDRYIKVDDKIYRFSNQDNLSMEDLHKEVYKNLPFEPEAKSLYHIMKVIDYIKNV
jgi:predicted dehydrogenase